MDLKVDQNKIKELRLSKSWSQEELAEKASVSLRTIQRMELDGSASLKSRRAVADALGVEPTKLDLQNTSEVEEAGSQHSAAPGATKKGFFNELFAYPGPSSISNRFRTAVLVTLWLLMVVAGSLILLMTVPLAVWNTLNPDELIGQILITQIPLLLIFAISIGLYVFFKRFSSSASH